jgi:hypothetical protein
MSNHTSGGAVSRRQAIVAVSAVAVLPKIDEASPVDPHIAWLQEWRALNERDKAAMEVGNDDDSIYADMCVIADRIEKKPASTAEGLAAKLRLFAESNGNFEDCFIDPRAIKARIDEVIAFLGAGQ